MYCYVVKLPVFRHQRGSAKSPIAPSNFSPLWPNQPIDLGYVGKIAYWVSIVRDTMAFIQLHWCRKTLSKPLKLTKIGESTLPCRNWILSQRMFS